MWPEWSVTRWDGYSLCRWGEKWWNDTVAETWNEKSYDDWRRCWRWRDKSIWLFRKSVFQSAKSCACRQLGEQSYTTFWIEDELINSSNCFVSSKWQCDEHALIGLFHTHSLMHTWSFKDRCSSSSHTILSETWYACITCIDTQSWSEYELNEISTYWFYPSLGH
jgi:hypothetical protein